MKEKPSRFEPKAEYADGIAVIATPTRESTVHVGATARQFIDGMPIRPTKTGALALSLGYIAQTAEVERLEAELIAARAGEIGRKQAEDMQGARHVIAELRHAAERFMEIYDQGDAPDSARENTLRAQIAEAESWLVSDVHACAVRQKILK